MNKTITKDDKGFSVEASASDPNELLVQHIRQEYTSFKSIVCEDEPDARTVWLDVGVQHFKIADAENAEHAEWYRDTLAKALTKIIKDMQAH